MTYSTIDSPIGPLTIVARDEKLVAIYMEQHARRPDVAALGQRVDDVLPEVTRQLAEYFGGERREFDLPLAATGTDFQHRVWAVLRTIPYGETWSYGQLAAALGQPGASRAVGLANGRNPISIVVPCHRVVGANGSLTGYAGGTDRKRFLLALERGRVEGADALFG